MVGFLILTCLTYATPNARGMGLSNKLCAILQRSWDKSALAENFSWPRDTTQPRGAQRWPTAHNSCYTVPPRDESTISLL